MTFFFFFFFFFYSTSPRNTLTHHVLESTAVTFTTVVFINNIFLSCNEIVGLSWFEKEACTTGSTKLDGIALAVKDRKYDEAKLLEKMAGLIENKLFFGIFSIFDKERL
ncbi:hypothetical protein INT48_004036, partial [Thamnidium elegans]